jgi:hypothetical protein
MERDDVDRFRRNRQDEVDSATVYEAMAMGSGSPSGAPASSTGDRSTSSDTRVPWIPPVMNTRGPG